MFAPTEMRRGWEPPVVDPEVVRGKLTRALEALRACKSGSPWPDDRTRRNRIIFPQMANWLPQDEADRLRAEFRAELERLDLAG